MRVDHTQPQVVSEPVLERQITDAPDLQHLHQDVRAFLADMTETVIADTALVVVMLVGDAHRYGAPPVTLRMRREAGGSSLRVEVEDRRTAGSDPTPEDYRISLLDRMTTARGVEKSDGLIITWAEIALTYKDPDGAADVPE
jgi:hypothetical protein